MNWPGKSNISKPRVYIIPDDSPNAFATGRNPEHAAIAATEGIMRLLTPAELKGVLAHEIGHVRNRDILISTIAATMAGAIMILAAAESKKPESTTSKAVNRRVWRR